MIDYAHNGISATALFTMLRDYDPGRIVVIFGAEGGRAQVRRQELGEVCGKLADFCILSSQNPDFEPLEDIFRDIHVYLDPTGTPAVDIADRHEAIRYALRNARKGDFIAVIGKGQEDYELVKGIKYPWSDREEIEAALKELGWKE
jgi:UDP-N-acetylmuramoyl-L-alanyl-D-glutamate--2,6-diaminopimelate ligase